MSRLDYSHRARNHRRSDTVRAAVRTVPIGGETDVLGLRIQVRPHGKTSVRLIISQQTPIDSACVDDDNRSDKQAAPVASPQAEQI